MTENVKKLAHQLIEWGVLHGAQDVYFLPNDTEIPSLFGQGCNGHFTHKFPQK